MQRADPSGAGQERPQASQPQNNPDGGPTRCAFQLGFHVMSLRNPGSDYKPTGERPPTGSGRFGCSDGLGLTRKLHVDEKETRKIPRQPVQKCRARESCDGATVALGAGGSGPWRGAGPRASTGRASPAVLTEPIGCLL